MKVNVNFNFSGEVEVPDGTTPQDAINQVIAMGDKALPFETRPTCDYFVYVDSTMERHTTIFPSGKREDWG